MQRLRELLPTWLGGPKRPNATALCRLSEHIRSQPDNEDSELISVTIGREKWEGAIMELRLFGNVTAVQDFSAQMLAAVPPHSEVSFITLSSPLAHLTQTESGTTSAQDRLASLLRPAPNRVAKRIRTYVLVRTKPGARPDDWLDAVRMAAQRNNIAHRSLSNVEASEFLSGWQGPRSAASEAAAWADLTLEPGTSSYHPLHMPNFDKRVNEETWETVTFAVNETGENARHVASSVVVFGAQPDVHQALAALIAKYHRRGIAVRATAYGQVGDEAVPRMPWLQPLSSKSKRQRKGEHSFDARRVAALLPFPLSGTDETPPNWQQYALPAFSNLGALTHLHGRPGQYGGHTLALGVAGSGATYMANAQLAAHLRGGGQAWALRWQDAPVFNEVAEGTTYDIAVDSAFSINPLSGIASEQHLWDVFSILRSWLAMLANNPPKSPFDRPNAPLTTTEYFLLERALEKAWCCAGTELGLTFVLEELAQLSQEGSDLAGRIRARVNALPPEWFEGPNTVDITANYVSIHLGSLSTVHRELAAASMLVLHHRAIVSLPAQTPKLLVVDEAGMFGQEGAEHLLAAHLRTLRMRNAAAFICARPFSAEHKGQTPHERVLDEHCENKVLMYCMHQEAEWATRYERALGYRITCAPPSRNGASRFIWVQEPRGSAAILELELCQEATVAFAPGPWREAAYREARAAGEPIENALKLAVIASPPKRD